MGKKRNRKKRQELQIPWHQAQVVQYLARDASKKFWMGASFALFVALIAVTMILK